MTAAAKKLLVHGGEVAFGSTAAAADDFSVPVGGSWQIRAGEQTLSIEPPVMRVDGESVRCEVEHLTMAGVPRRTRNGSLETVLTGCVSAVPGLVLRTVLRTDERSPIVRFRYELESSGGHRLTKRAGVDELTFCSIKRPRTTAFVEVRLSDFVELGHTFMPVERRLDARDSLALSPIHGPILVGEEGDVSWLLAYEHGSSGGDTYCGFAATGGGGIAIQGVKGSYLDGQALSKELPFRTPWLHAAVIPGSLDEVAAAFRAFLLNVQSENLESRTPQIFYNTWNFQERERYWFDRSYIQRLDEKRVLDEVEVAASIGVDTYVIDTGWYEATGDWRPSPTRFPNGIRPIQERAHALGMRLGLWFDPTAAALSSDALSSHRKDVVTWRGAEQPPRPIWETEDSHRMCLVSEWMETLISHLERAHREWGVTYFKLDAVGQHGCDSALHHHGDQTHSSAERAARFSFLMNDRMTEIGQRLIVSCPGSIVDFDVTENGRSFGLSFLSVGKYFLVNNGPYYSDYGLPADLGGTNTNMFFHPGPARNWICREPYAFDRWVPSVLTLVHYYPDDPVVLQNQSLASLLLGHHGIWGDLLSVSEDGVQRLAEAIKRYRPVAFDTRETAMLTQGRGAGAFEVREKVHPVTGRGVISVFPADGDLVRYVTSVRVDRDHWSTEGTAVHLLPDGRALIESKSAGIVIFGR